MRSDPLVAARQPRPAAYRGRCAAGRGWLEHRGAASFDVDVALHLNVRLRWFSKGAAVEDEIL